MKKNKTLMFKNNFELLKLLKKRYIERQRCKKIVFRASSRMGKMLQSIFIFFLFNYDRYFFLLWGSIVTIAIFSNSIFFFFNFEVQFLYAA